MAKKFTELRSRMSPASQDRAEVKALNAKLEADEAIHSAASGLFKAGVIGKKTMREYDTLTLDELNEVNYANEKDYPA